MEIEENSFTMVGDDGKEVVYDVLFTFQMEDTDKDYIVYTDNTKDDDGNIQVYASIYTTVDGNMNLESITSESEWKTIETILKTIQDEIQNSGK